MQQEKQKIAILGLGYVGLQLAVAFAKHQTVLGYDYDAKRIAELKKNEDRNGIINANQLKASKLDLTSESKHLQRSNIYFIAVPTSINEAKIPNLKNLKEATKTLAIFLKKDDIVIYESTVYPGTTEDICIPILESNSGLIAGKDFFVAYSPERVDPGNTEHRLDNTSKVISAQNSKTLATVKQLYSRIIDAELFPVSNIKTAEAVKIIENTQRDLNISLMNEMAIVFNKMGVNVREVLAAAATKWNFMNFEPGLVGGDCIGADPYYFIYKAESLGFHEELITTARNINDKMGEYIAQQTVKCLIAQNIRVKQANVVIMGAAYKENSKVVHNSRVLDIIHELESYDVNVKVFDPLVDKQVTQENFGVKLVEETEFKDFDAVILAMKHDVFGKYSAQKINKILNKPGVVVDVKGQWFQAQNFDSDIYYWCL